jgi:hypothetical protein
MDFSLRGLLLDRNVPAFCLSGLMTSCSPKGGRRPWECPAPNETARTVILCAQIIHGVFRITP